jgi:hypothetical protein
MFIFAGVCSLKKLQRLFFVCLYRCEFVFMPIYDKISFY